MHKKDRKQWKLRIKMIGWRGELLTLSEMNKKGVRVLEDGTIIEGLGFGAIKKVSGEVVFNTGMVGYVETIIDPHTIGRS